MKSHETTNLATSSRRLAGAIEIGSHDVLSWQSPGAAMLRVTGGAAWVTRAGEPTDHVLCTGEAMAVSRGDLLVMEPLRTDTPAYLEWRLAEPVPAAGGTVSGWLDGLRDRGAAFAARARRAASRANLAQGSAMAGESSASWGIV